MLSLKINYNLLDSKNIVKEKFQTILMKSMFKMEELAIDKAPFDVGELREKITLFPEILANEYKLSSKAKHSEAMEYGTVPFWAPIKPLKEWARRKLHDEGAAYAIQKSIAKHGIRAQPFMRPALYTVESYWLPLYSESVLSSI